MSRVTKRKSRVTPKKAHTSKIDPRMIELERILFELHAATLSDTSEPPFGRQVETPIKSKIASLEKRAKEFAFEAIAYNPAGLSLSDFAVFARYVMYWYSRFNGEADISEEASHFAHMAHLIVLATGHDYDSAVQLDALVRHATRSDVYKVELLPAR